uniref:3'-5' exonuclease domain-containing protein n=2 Tax=Guillardia theta TaxID=55529 RepID=A0A7S4P7R1_GUITH|mmetsp:Transcript_44826/g.141148  ORF Transcript_44826/g.141148 Transcript_44826/m.141148 type:complete len:312 (+) Transcript_44826:192-1127(+)
MWQLVEQLGDAKEEVRQAVYEEVKGARCWRKAVALLKRWELTDVKSDFLLECATLELLMSKGLKSDAWEYVGEKEELVRVMEETYQVKRPQGSTTSEVKSEETLSLPGSVDIVWVDTLNELGKCRRFLEAMGAGEILGIDTEWRYPRPCSLVQLAIQDTVYLLDCVKAEEDLEFGSSLGNLLGWIFSRECQLRRVGFAFTGDVENLQAAFPTLREMEVCVEDCQELASRSLGEQEEAEAAGWTPLTLSLSSLCRRIWGKRLDKSEQCSNWDRRPLRSSQTIYAALDAHVLLGIHRHFQHLILEKKRADERE